MATGDLANNLGRLQRSLRHIKYGGHLDIAGAKQGHPTAFLPLLHYTLLSFSNRISEFIVERGYELYGKSDLRFMEAVYRLFRNELNYSPRLSKDQFFSVGYAELKMILVVDVIALIIKQQRTLVRKAKAKRSLSSHPPPRVHASAREAFRKPLSQEEQAAKRIHSLSSSYHGLRDSALASSHAELGPRATLATLDTELSPDDYDFDLSPNTSIVSGPRRDYDSGAYAPRPEHDYLSSLRADVPPPPNHSSVLELTREDLELSMPVVAQSRTAPTMAAPARSVPHVLAGLNQRVMDLAQRMARLDVTQSHLRETAVDHLESAKAHADSETDMIGPRSPVASPTRARSTRTAAQQPYAPQPYTQQPFAQQPYMPQPYAQQQPYAEQPAQQPSAQEPAALAEVLHQLEATQTVLSQLSHRVQRLEQADHTDSSRHVLLESRLSLLESARVPTTSSSASRGGTEPTHQTSPPASLRSADIRGTYRPDDDLPSLRGPLGDRDYSLDGLGLLPAGLGTALPPTTDQYNYDDGADEFVSPFANLATSQVAGTLQAGSANGWRYHRPDLEEEQPSQSRRTESWQLPSAPSYAPSLSARSTSSQQAM